MSIGTYQPTRCRAHNRRGDPCSSFPIHGGSVCVTHGGRAPQVRAAADQRIRDLAPKAITVIEDLLDEADSPGIRLAAARDILDRAGYSAKQRIEHSGEVTSGDRLTTEQRAAVAKVILGS